MSMGTQTASASLEDMASLDKELAHKCQQGDVDAYAQLVHRHRKMVYRVAYAILGDAEDAEDVVQEAFVRGYQAISRYDARYAFADWIRRITVNCALTRLRKQRRLGNGTSLSALVTGEAADADPAGHAATNDLQDEVRQALAALPPRQRAAITLFALADMDLAGVAEAMGCAVGTVKSHLHRARQKLAELLADYVEED